MANLTSAQDIIEDVLKRAGQNTTTADPFYTRAVELVNRSRHDLIKGISPLNPKEQVNFKWAIRHPADNFIIQPKETTASSVSVTQSSSSVTFSSSITTDVAGWYLIMDGEKDVYRIATHGGSTDAATLDSVYTGTTNTTASFKLVKLEYELGSNDIVRLISPLTIFRTNLNDNPEYKVYGIGEEEFDRNYPLATVSQGTPEYYKVVKILDNNWTIMLNRYSDTELIKAHYRIIPLYDDIDANSSNSSIIVPREFRYVIADWALSLLQVDKSDNKAGDSLAKAQAGYEAMVKSDKLTGKDLSPNYGQFVSREDYYYRGIYRNNS